MISKGEVQHTWGRFKNTYAVPWISGCPVAKCDPLRGRAIQHDHQSRPMDDPSPDRWEHDQMENMQILR